MLLALIVNLKKRSQGADRGGKDEQHEIAAVTLLYKDRSHPPSGYLCLPYPSFSVTPTSIAQARDGSYTNILFPNLGKAGSPYARSVPSLHLLPPFALPHSGLLFDTLLKREELVPHPGGIPSLFFTFSDLVPFSL